MNGEHVVPDWRHRAACVGVDPDVVFPVGESGPSVALQVEAAKAVCAGCPVAGECLAWALETVQVHGVWGGRSGGERPTVMRCGRQRSVARLASRVAARAGLETGEACPPGTTPPGAAAESAVVPGKWRQAGEVEPHLVFGVAAVVVMALTVLAVAT